MARAPLRDTDPAQVGRYRLTARLGAGGMGVVYLGTARDGTLVAVKVLRPELTDDPEFRDRFGREVTNLTRVKGVCTVRVIEADTESARPFMVTEYVPGPSLSEYVARYGPPGPEMMYGLATGLAEALTAIHAAGVVHRDLKPSNVILGQDGPKVIDFGIAQALDATSVTRTGMMVGSAGFMAPEQVTGRAGQPADIFAWAVTLTYAASGEMPFGTGSSDAILYRILHTEPDTAAVPELLKPLVEAALVKDPLRRPRADELLARLTSRAQAGRDYEFNTQAVLAQVWPATEVTPVQQPRTTGSLLLEPGPPKSRRPRRGVLSRRTATVGGPAVMTAANPSGYVGDRVVALGQATTAGRSVPFAELSANGGASWQEAPFGSAGPGVAVTALTASSGSFTAASQSGAPGQQNAQIWTSATGSAWAPAQVSGLSGGGAHEITALVSAGSAVTGIGTTATQQAQQPVTVSLAGG